MTAWLDDGGVKAPGQVVPHDRRKHGEDHRDASTVPTVLAMVL
jgi:hypothetical protein